MRFQPSELGKLALIVWLAHWLAKEKRRLNKFRRGFAIPMGVVSCVLVLVLVEPDFGSTALLASVSFALMFIAGVRLRFLVPTIFTGAGGFVALMIHNPERSRRLMAPATRSGRRFWRSDRAGSTESDWATVGRRCSTCRKLTQILFFPLSARNWGWWGPLESCLPLHFWLPVPSLSRSARPTFSASTSAWASPC